MIYRIFIEGDLDKSVGGDLRLHVSRLQRDSTSVEVVCEVQTWAAADLTRNEREPRHGEIGVEAKHGPCVHDLICVQ